MPYILRRTGQGGGRVAGIGSRTSYTHRKRSARLYPTREAAEADRCIENEVIEETFDDTL